MDAVADREVPELEFRIRIGTDLDRSFVAHHWVRSYSRSEWSRLSAGSYFRGHNRAVDRCLSRPGVRLLVAHVPDDPGALLGFAVFEDANVIHFVFVRPDARRMGLARTMIEAGISPALLDSGELVFTHRAGEIWGRCAPLGRFDPYKFFFAEGTP